MLSGTKKNVHTSDNLNGIITCTRYTSIQHDSSLVH